MMYAGARKGYNPWMRDITPQMRPDYGQIEATEAEEMVEAFLDQSSPPPDAQIQNRFGAEKTYPTIADVLGVPSKSGLREADTGQQGYGGPALGKW